jgi:hypothetical protein
MAQGRRGLTGAPSNIKNMSENYRLIILKYLLIMFSLYNGNFTCILSLIHGPTLMGSHCTPITSLYKAINVAYINNWLNTAI